VRKGRILKKSRILLLDANVVLEISRHELWKQLTKRHEIHLSQTVLDESQFYDDDAGRHYIDLNHLIDDSLITICHASIDEVKAFRDLFEQDYFSRLDAGEAESLTILLKEEAEYLICSADAIVFKVLGNLRKPDLSISLEKVLSEAGLGRELEWPFTEDFRRKWLAAGSQDRIQDRGLKE